MSKFIVEGNIKLKGKIIPQGNKNEALPILAATLLTDKPIVISNIPKITDVLIMIKLIKILGVEVEKLEEHKYKFTAKKVISENLDINLASELRGSLTLLSGIIKRCGKVFFPRPGGDKIGRRRIDTHILVFKSFGVNIEIISSGYSLFSNKKFTGTEILLDEMSVTATENAIMAASTAKGTTIIKNAASEPHIQRLCEFINLLGGKITGIGSNILTIEGVSELAGGNHIISPDYLEVGSFIGMAVVTNSEITIKNAGIKDLKMIINVFSRLGVSLDCIGDDIYVPKNQSLNIEFDCHGIIAKIDDSPWPGFPADLISIALVVATQCSGTILFFEKMYESRLFFVDKLIAMGAKIILCDPHRALVTGPANLIGSTLTSPDIRAGVAMLIAAMAARGTSVIHNIAQIDRGYEDIETRLRKLGARITRID